MCETRFGDNEILKLIKEVHQDKNRGIGYTWPRELSETN
jgi:hypothetical protein